MDTATKWRIIQRAIGVEPDGQPGNKTADAVAAKLNLRFAILDEAAKPTTEPPWMIEARKHIGLAEIPGPKHNGQILKWWEAIKSSFRDDETPWCAAFVGGCLEAVGIESTRSAAARSYFNHPRFRKLPRPAQGCIVVFWRGSPNGWSGHVAFLAGIADNGDLWCIGGNQSDKVTLAKFSPSRLIGFYWPNLSPAGLQQPPRRMNAAGQYSTNEA